MNHKSESNKELFVFVIVFLIIALFTKTYVGSGNVASRFATIESLVEKGTFVIDNSTFFGNAKTYPIKGEKPIMRLNDFEGINGTNDKVFINGHFYSDKPPTLSALAAAFYWFLYMLGITFTNKPGLAVYLLTLFTVGAMVSIFSVFFYKFCNRLKVGTKYALILTLFLVFTTLLFPYSVTFNNHIFSACLTFLAFYFLYFGKRKIHMFFSGFLASLSLVTDIAAGGVFLVAFFIYSIWRKNARMCLFYGLGTILPLLIHFILNYLISGGITPMAINPEYFKYTGSDFDESTLTGVAMHRDLLNILLYGFHSLFGYRGLFLYTPVLLLGIFMAFYMAKEKRMYFRLETVLIFLSCLAIFLYYTLFSVNYGGWSYGMRWFVSFIPMLYLLNVFIFTKPNKNKNLIKMFFLLSFFSFVVSVIGVYQPWTDMWYSSFPIVNNLKDIFRGVYYYIK